MSDFLRVEREIDLHFVLVVLAGMALTAGAIWSVFVISEGYLRAQDAFSVAEKACEELVPPGLADSPERHACLERELARPSRPATSRDRR